jgi:acetate kinase
VMGTRPGDLDPGLMVYLFRQAAKDGADAAAAIEAMVNHKAGMVALSELENDMRVVREAAANGNADAKLALAVFVRSVTKALGAACFLLGGLDAIVFTGGIGQHDAATRAEALAGLTPLEIGIDPERNAAAGGKAVSDITASNSQSRTTDSSNIGSKTRILVLTAQEDLMIARHVDGMLTAAGQGPRQA